MAEKNGWRYIVFAAAATLVGGLLGSTYQQYLNSELARTQRFEEGQRAAYVAFVKAFDKWRVSEREKSAGHNQKAEEMKREYELEASAAGRLISLYGDAQVVTAMANWYRSFPELPVCKNEVETELALWEQMRASTLGKKQNVSLHDLAPVTAYCKLAAGR